MFLQQVGGVQAETITTRPVDDRCKPEALLEASLERQQLSFLDGGTKIPQERIAPRRRFLERRRDPGMKLQPDRALPAFELAAQEAYHIGILEHWVGQ